MGPTELTTSASPDLPRHHHHAFPPLSPVDGGKSLGSMNMDDILHNIYPADSPPVVHPVSREVGKTAEEVWKEISGEKKVGEGGAPEEAAGTYGTEVTMTLEDYLARAGVVGDVRVGGVVGHQRGAVEGGMMVVPMDYGQQRQKDEGFLGFGDGGLDDGSGGGGGGGGRGRRILQDQADKVAEQRQRRMIKNRESAARSRERKQAYTVELESRVARLEEQNSELKQQQEERTRKRLKHLLETRIPVNEREKPRRRLPKTLSL